MMINARNTPWLLVGCAVAAVILLPGCSMLEQLTIDCSVADQLLANDVITQAQHTALTGAGWKPLVYGLINTVSTLVIGFPLLVKWRGPATKVENVAKKKAAKAKPADIVPPPVA